MQKIFTAFILYCIYLKLMKNPSLKSNLKCSRGTKNRSSYKKSSSNGEIRVIESLLYLRVNKFKVSFHKSIVE